MGRIHYLLIVLVLIGTSCTVNRDIMFKTPTDYVFDTPPDTVESNFKIQPNDVLRFRLFANDGFKIIDLVSTGGDLRLLNSQTLFTYLVESDGFVKLPLIGRVHLAGRTMRDAETYLEELYTKDYNRPFVQLSISNRRVVVFPGDGGDADVVLLANNNTTLIEVLALANGVSRRGNVSQVRVFRKQKDGTRLVYDLDLSTIDGLKSADMIMQTSDVVYVTPNPELAREFLYDITPIVTLLSTLVLTYGIIRGFN